MTSAFEEGSESFADNILPLYNGPRVHLRIQPSNKEYTISRDLLCAASPVFSKMFNGEFLESQQQAATLEETEDVVSVRSLQALFQWLYQRVVIFKIEDPGEHISAALELARLADKYDIKPLETTVAQYIKTLLISNPHPNNTEFLRHFDSNTYYLKRDHIVSATKLPERHPVRSIIAAASVEGYLRSLEHKFREETEAFPSFAADLLREMRTTLHKVQPRNTVTFEDPISGTKSELSSNVFFLD